MNRIEEFWYCVASQEDLPLYKGHEISSDSCERLLNLVEIYKELKEEEDSEKIIQRMICAYPDVISDMRVLVGVSDKRLYLDLTYLVHMYSLYDGVRFVPESREHLLKHDTKYFIGLLKKSPQRYELAEQVTDYFIEKGLIDILDTFSSMKRKKIKTIFHNLIAPKEIQQMQAKYRGHGAEQVFAQIIKACGLKIIPENKDIDPMAGHDPNVNLSTMTVVPRDAGDENCHSFDLVVKEGSKIRVLIQSLIHSSDPGQYGVNKSDETIDIKKRICAYNNRLNPEHPVYLLGCVDGVGFCENPNGTIVKMLKEFDDFFQMHTLFKIPLFLQRIGMINHVKGIVFDTEYFEKEAIKYFVNAYVEPAGVLNLTDEVKYRVPTLRFGLIEFGRAIEAGKALVIFE